MPIVLGCKPVFSKSVKSNRGLNLSALLKTNHSKSSFLACANYQRTLLQLRAIFQNLKSIDKKTKVYSSQSNSN